MKVQENTFTNNLSFRLYVLKMSDFTSVGLQNFPEVNSRRPIDEGKFCKDTREIAYIQDLKPKAQVNI